MSLSSMSLRSTLWIGLVILVAGCSEDGFRGPYLQNVTADSVTIGFQSPVAEDGTLEWGPDASYGFVETSPKQKKHFVTLNALLPDTTYHYKLSGGGKNLTSDLTFKTAPDSSGLKMAFIAFGDSGSGIYSQGQVADAIGKVEFDLAIHTGDVVYPNGSDADYFKKFFSPYREWLTSTPLWPSLGNHDIMSGNGAPYLENFALPNGNNAKERYYSFDWGHAHFVSLSTGDSLQSQPPSPQYTWLADDLAQSAATWKFVFFHEPIFATGSHKERQDLDHLAGLFTNHDVDVVFQGHNHHYERLDQYQGQGPIYIVTGGGGAILYPSIFGRHKSANTSLVFEVKHHFVRVGLDGRDMLLEARDKDNKVFDTVTRTK